MGKNVYSDDNAQVPQKKFQKTCVSLLAQFLQYIKYSFNLLELLLVNRSKFNKGSAQC